MQIKSEFKVLRLFGSALVAFLLLPLVQIHAAGDPIKDLKDILSFDPAHVTHQLSGLDSQIPLGSERDWSKFNSSFEHIQLQASQGSAIVNALSSSLGGLVGSAVGSLSVEGIGFGFLGGLAAMGVKAAFDWVHENRTHEKHKAQLLSEFSGALEKHHKLQPVRDAREKEFNSRLYLMNLVHLESNYSKDQASLSSEESKVRRSVADVLAITKPSGDYRAMLIHRLDTFIFENENQLETVDKLFSKLENAPKESIEKLKNLRVQLYETVQQSTVLRKVLTETTDSATCKQLQSGIDDLFNYDRDLQYLRFRLLNPEGQTLWLTAFDEFFHSNQAFANQSQSTASCQSRVDEWADLDETFYYRQLDGLPEMKKILNKAMTQCLYEQYGLYWTAFLATNQMRKDCKRYITHPAAKFAVKNGYSQTIEPLFQQYMQRTIAMHEACLLLDKAGLARLNGKLHEVSRQNYIEFFLRLANEQADAVITERVNHLENMKQKVQQVCAQY